MRPRPECMSSSTDEFVRAEYISASAFKDTVAKLKRENDEKAEQAQQEYESALKSINEELEAALRSKTEFEDNMREEITSLVQRLQKEEKMKIQALQDSKDDELGVVKRKHEEQMQSMRSDMEEKKKENINALNSKDDELGEVKRKHEEQMQSMRSDMEKTKKENINALDALAKSKDGEMEDMRKTYEEQMQWTISDLKEKSKEKLNAALARREGLETCLREEIAALKEEGEATQKVLASVKTVLEHSKSSESSLNSRLETIEKEYANLIDNAKELKQQNEAIEKASTNQRSHITTLKEEIKVAGAESEKNRKVISSLKDELKTTETDLENLKVAYSCKEKETTALKEKIDTLLRNLKLAEKEREDTEREHNATVRALKIERETMQEEHSKSKESLKNCIDLLQEEKKNAEQEHSSFIQAYKKETVATKAQIDKTMQDLNEAEREKERMAKDNAAIVAELRSELLSVRSSKAEIEESLQECRKVMEQQQFADVKRQGELEKYKQSNDILRSKEKSLSVHVQSLESQISRMTSRHDKETDDLNALLEDASTEKSKVEADLLDQIKVLKQDRTLADEEHRAGRDDMEKDNASLKEKVNVLVRDLKNAAREKEDAMKDHAHIVEVLNKNIETAQLDKDALEKSLKGEIALLKRERHDVKANLEKQRKEAARARSELSASVRLTVQESNEKELLRGEYEKKLNRMKAELEAVQLSKVDAEESLLQKKKKIDLLERKEKKRTGDLAKQVQSIEVLKSKEKSLESLVQSLESQISSIVSEYETRLQGALGGETTQGYLGKQTQAIETLKAKERSLENHVRTLESEKKEMHGTMKEMVSIIETLQKSQAAAESEHSSGSSVAEIRAKVRTQAVHSASKDQRYHILEGRSDLEAAHE